MFQSLRFVCIYSLFILEFFDRLRKLLSNRYLYNFTKWKYFNMDYLTKNENEQGKKSSCTNCYVWELRESNSGGVSTTTITAQSTYILRCEDWLIVKTHWSAQYGNYVCFKNILAIETLSKTQIGEIESRGRPILNFEKRKRKYASMRRLTDLKF